MRVYDRHQNGLVAVSDYDIRPELHAVTCPLMLLSAEGDKLLQYTQRAAMALPQVPLLVQVEPIQYL